MQTIHEPARNTPVAATVNLCVIGGSCTGLFAAVRAARLGLSVAIVEKQSGFGGIATSGLVNIWHSLHDVDHKQQIIAGLTAETIARLDKRQGVERSDNVNSAYRLDTELLKIELDKYAAESGLQAFLHTMYAAPYLADGALKGVFIENKDGRQAILADFVIDASGDGDVARDLALPAYRLPHMQPPTPGFKLLGDMRGLDIDSILQAHGAEFGLADDWGWGGKIPGSPMLSFRADTHVFDVDCSKATDLTKAEMEGRKQILAVLDTLNAYTPNAGGLQLAAICSYIGIRDSRHFDSDYRLNAHDLLNGKAFPDAIAFGTYRVDIHHADDAGITFRDLDGNEYIHHDRTSPPERRRWRTGDDYARYYQIPFAALVQRQYSNFLMAGRMINADMDAFGAVRVMVNLNQIGEAAGVAAYTAVADGAPVWALDTAKIQRLLVQGGSAAVV